MTAAGDLRTAAAAPALAASLVALSRDFYHRGWMPGTSGNLSTRFGTDNRIALITASGRGKGELIEDDTVAVYAETGEAVEPDAPRPSAETPIHAAIYRSTEAAAVVHVHAPYSTVVSGLAGERARVVELSITRFELLKGLGVPDASAIRLPVFPNWPDVPRIADDIADHLAGDPCAPPGLLIADHGITVWGRDLAQAGNRLECLEAICQLLVLGGVPLEVAPPGNQSSLPRGKAER